MSPGGGEEGNEVKPDQPWLVKIEKSSPLRPFIKYTWNPGGVLVRFVAMILHATKLIYKNFRRLNKTLNI